MKWLMSLFLLAIMASPANAGANLEPQLCFQKIKQAYDQVDVNGAFTLADKACLKYKNYYDFKYRGGQYYIPAIPYDETLERRKCYDALMRNGPPEYQGLQHIWECRRFQEISNKYHNRYLLPKR